MTFAGFHAHGSIRTVWKALEFNRRKGGLGDEKAQTEKRESKRQSSHGPFLLFIDPRGLKQCHEATGEPPPPTQIKNPAPPRFQAVTSGPRPFCHLDFRFTPAAGAGAAQGFPALINSVPDKRLLLI